MATRKAFVLLSGGLDSTTCLFKAIFDFQPQDLGGGYGDPEVLHGYINSLRDHEDAEPRDSINWVEAVSINYGQRHIKEANYAADTCRKLGIQHTILTLPDLIVDANTMLANKDIPIPNKSYADIEGVSPTYVPNRNMVMLSLLTAHAQKWINAQQAKEIISDPTIYSAGVYFGAHAEDAHNWAYPDCTPEFIGSMANAIYMASYHQIRLHTPLMNMQKKDVVKLGYELGVHFEDTWSCYQGDEYHCGTCMTCRSRKEAFIAAGVPDPTEYQDERSRLELA